jgi:hypothetical protein
MAIEDLEARYQNFIKAYATNKTKTHKQLAEEFECTDDTITAWKTKYADEIATLLKESEIEIRMELAKFGLAGVKKLVELLEAKETVTIKDVDGNSTMTGEKPNLQVQLGSAKALVEVNSVKRTESAVEMTGKTVSISIEEAK